MTLIFDPITAINLLFCIGIVLISIWWHWKAKSWTPIYIGLAFGLFGVSHTATLLDLKNSLEMPLIIIRGAAYAFVLIGLFFGARDVLIRQKAERDLRESERKYRTILTNIQDVFYRSDKIGKLIMASPSWAHLLGYDSVEECYGRDMARDFYQHPADRTNFCKIVYTAGTIQDYEVELKKKDGSPLFVSTNSHVYYDDDGAVAGIEGIFRDITERKLAEKNLVRANEELSAANEQLTAIEEELRRNFDDLARSQNALEQARKKLNVLNTVTFQDIQNAIFSLSGYFELEKQVATDERLRRYIDKQMAIVQTISDSLKFAEYYQNLGLIPPAWQDVQSTFLMGISRLDVSGLSRNVDVNGLEVFADSLLENVFFTLTENVVLNGETATAFSLSCRRTTGGVILAFEDDGVGIPYDMKEKIFERRYEKKKGIGLFLTREILEITGMTIHETGEPGIGSRFEISIPEGMYRFAGR
jgi:PAS domain S-box-containing protein